MRFLTALSQFHPLSLLFEQEFAMCCDWQGAAQKQVSALLLNEYHRGETAEKVIFIIIIIYIKVPFLVHSSVVTISRAFQ